MKSESDTRHSGNGTYTAAAALAACDANSYLSHHQSNHNSTTSNIISDAMILSAQEEAKKSELELKSLCESQDKMKGRSSA
jgi:hypothetical protein